MSAGFTESWAFSKPWRPYQARVLEDLEEALGDGQVHIVAAPGSGKTVLGLEIVRRLGHPALVLSPTITVREQWVHRLRSDYLGAELKQEDPGWVSRDLLESGDFTAVTYQSLSTAFRKPRGRKKVAGGFARGGLGTIVLDEAHHLRGHWWTCLERLREDFPEAVIVALTATPPYDVPQVEWNRYAGLCGPVDAEISAPELVREKNLCPHQDYIYFTAPLPTELAEVQRFDQYRDSLVTDLRSDVEGAACLASHPLFSCGLPAKKEVLAELDWFLSVLLYLREVGGSCPTRLEEVLGLRGVALPELDLHWLQVFLQGLLGKWHEKMSWYAPMVPHLRRIRQRLVEAGAYEKGHVILLNSRANRRLLSASPSKIAAVADILEAELQEMGVLLRAVVLADHIREEVLQLAAPGEVVFEKLGVVPIFEALRRRDIPLLHAAVLTGRLVIVPKTAMDALSAQLPELIELGARPLPHAPDFMQITVADAARHRIVGAVTEIFCAGHLNVLVGTAALLGEGWDAPATNTLVLASSIGSFMTANQMRGRAIRQDPDDPDKVANIWHLACLTGDGQGAGSEDLGLLSRRFGSYAGLSLRGSPPTISEGITRMGLRIGISSEEALASNPDTLKLAADRIELQKRWREALPGDENKSRFRPVREVVVRQPSHTVRVGTRARWLSWIPGASFYRRWQKRRNLTTQIKQIRGYGLAVLRGLEARREFAEPVLDSHVSVSSGEKDVVVLLEVESVAEQRRFAVAMEELFELLRQPAPRYLIRSGRQWFAVPSELDGHRATANAFLNAWRLHVNRRASLVYVHGEAGREAMLEAKRDALLGRFTWVSAARTRWGQGNLECDGGGD